MWQKDRSAERAGRLENLKELVRSMEEFPDLAGFLEHVSLVMDATDSDGAERVSIMTLHAAKGLEFDTVFLPGWEEGLFPNQRALDESGRAGLEEERRLAYVGLTRARAPRQDLLRLNRRIHGLWQSTIPSRFLDELPEAHVEVTEAPATSSTAAMAAARASTATAALRLDLRHPRLAARPGQHSAARRRRRHSAPRPVPTARAPLAAARARSRASSSPNRPGTLGLRARRPRLPHQVRQRHVAGVDGNKLTIDFDKAGRKMVLDSFVQRGVRRPAGQARTSGAAGSAGIA